LWEVKETGQGEGASGDQVLSGSQKKEKKGSMREEKYDLPSVKKGTGGVA